MFTVSCHPSLILWGYLSNCIKKTFLTRKYRILITYFLTGLNNRIFSKTTKTFTSIIFHEFSVTNIFVLVMSVFNVVANVVANINNNQNNNNNNNNNLQINKISTQNTQVNVYLRIFL